MTGLKKDQSFLLSWVLLQPVFSCFIYLILKRPLSMLGNYNNSIYDGNM